VGGAHNLVFSYGALSSASVNPTGDYNNDGIVNAADYVVWRKSGPNATLPNDSTPGTVSAADYTVWRANFGQTAGPSGPSTLITGFVRYVTSGLGSGSAVPEPASIFLAGLGFVFVVGAGRRKPTDC
jgi:hypothetical protein